MVETQDFIILKKLENQDEEESKFVSEIKENTDKALAQISNGDPLKVYCHLNCDD